MAKKLWVRELRTSGVTTEGFIEAETKEEAYDIVKSRGSTLIKIELRENNSEKKSLKDLGKINIIEEKVTIKDLANFCKQANTMLSAGMSLTRTLDVLTIQTTNKRFKAVIGEVVAEIQKGYQLSIALKMHPKVFPPLFISMVESGELTGNLDAILLSLAMHYNKESKLNAKVRSASAYPIVIGVVALVVLIGMLVFIVPIISEVFTDAGNELPAITQGLINLSNGVVNNWYYIVATIIIAIISFKFALKNEKFKLVIHKIIKRIPIVGPATVKIATSRFSRTLSTLLQSGIPLVQCLKSAASVTNNIIVINGVREISEEVKKGKSLNQLLANLNYFPTMMVSMVAIGEESGDLEGLLDRTADYYDDELEEAMDSITSIIEPVMIVIMAVVVAYMAFALLLPILDMASNIS